MGIEIKLNSKDEKRSFRSLYLMVLKLQAFERKKTEKISN